MQRQSQTRKRRKNLGVIPLEQPVKATKVKVESRWYRLSDSRRWIQVEFNPATGKIRSPYGIWQFPAEGSSLVKVKPQTQPQGQVQAPLKSSHKLEISKAETPTKKLSTREFLEQKALERKLREIEKHNLYISRQYGR